MGAVITFPEARQLLRATPTHGPLASATVIILPVIRIERDSELPTGSETTGTDATKSSSPRKRRRRATRP